MDKTETEYYCDYLDATVNDDYNLECSFLAAPPPPLEFADSDTTKSLSRFRPHSVTLGSESAKTGNVKTKHVSISPDWHKSFKFLLSKKSPKVAKYLKKPQSYGDCGKEANHEIIQNSSGNAPVRVNQTIVKRPSVSSKSFSIPLNASYCLNATSSPTDNSNNKFTSNSEILNFTCNNIDADDHNKIK